MARSKNTHKPAAFRPQLEAFETRLVPASLVPLSNFIPGAPSIPVLLTSSTAGDDTVTVSAVSINNVPFVRVVENGVTTNIPRAAITSGQVRFSGGDGDDYFDNNDASLSAIASGGNGSDELYGSANADTLSGDANGDTLGGDGGADTLRGGTGGDTLYGDGGNDRLFGESGGDTLYGGTGNDYLNGGTSADTLRGESGQDGLLGGQHDEGDTVTGGTGQDRFLDWTDNWFGLGENRTDVAAEDAVVFFRDTGEQTVLLGSNMGWRTYSAGEWSDSQIESIDKGMRILQDKTDNTRLLKTSGGGSLTWYKAGSTPGDPAGGWNSGGGSVTITNIGASSDAEIQRVTVHEIGHNWDTESPFYQSWLALSGWEANHMFINPVGKVPSTDGGWWHNANASFAYNYGKMNPLEDFATSWEAYFGLNGTQVSAKMDHLDLFFAYVDNLG